ncbi:MAG: glucokinase [Alphaproteobacteria bacterium]|nr:glucokinase [Alphaproteobacteria bacterium]
MESSALMNASTPKAVVGDIGGTNARFAIADLSTPSAPRISDVAHLPSADYPSLEAALADYLAGLRTRPPVAVLAVAGPVDNGEAVLTNLSWHVRSSALAALGFAAVSVINDFRALAAAADALQESDLERIGPHLSPPKDATIALVGAGTGFGAAALVREPGKTIALAGEGGHIGFSPEDDEEDAILRVLRARFGRISIERIVSGPGLVNLYAALADIHGEANDLDDPHAILAAAAQKQHLATRAVERFAGIFGAAAGDVALTFGARGGVLLAGGLSEAMLGILKAGSFRRRFEGKGRLAHFVRAVPTHMIKREDAALLGSARLAEALHPR